MQKYPAFTKGPSVLGAGSPMGRDILFSGGRRQVFVMGLGLGGEMSGI